MSERTAYVNGEFLPESRASVSIYDRGFLSGLGVFERTRTFQGEIFQLDRHIARLYRSLKAVSLDAGLTAGEMHQTTLELVEQNRGLLGADEDYFVGHYVSRGPDTAGRATVVILCEPIGFHKFAHHYIHGGHVITTHIRAIPTQVWDPKIKSTSRMHLWLAEQQAQLVDPEAYALLLSLEGNVTELTAANFWIVRNGTLVTAPVQTILSGVTRGAALEIARHLDIPVEETDFQLYDIMNADEAFMTTTSRCVLPLTRINGNAIGEGKPGPTVGTLQKGWTEVFGHDFVVQALKHLDKDKVPEGTEVPL